MTTNPPDMKIRISAALRRQIEDAAKRNNRTMNGEISARLERSFESDSTSSAQSDNANIRLANTGFHGDGEIQRRLKALEDDVDAIKKSLSRD